MNVNGGNVNLEELLTQTRVRIRISGHLCSYKTDVFVCFVSKSLRTSLLVCSDSLEKINSSQLLNVTY